MNLPFFGVRFWKTFLIDFLTSFDFEDEDLRASFDKFGRILEVRIFKAQGYAFVRFDKKESACNAICKMNGQEICGQNVKCSWGRTPEVGMLHNGILSYSTVTKSAVLE